MAVQHYAGGCQCGAVRYEVEVDLASTVTCNCSRCQRLGQVLAFTSKAKFTLHQGAANLTEYRFNAKKIAHLFCKTCGIQSFAYGISPDGTEAVGINVNALEGVDPRALKPHHVDGKTF